MSDLDIHIPESLTVEAGKAIFNGFIAKIEELPDAAVDRTQTEEGKNDPATLISESFQEFFKDWLPHYIPIAKEHGFEESFAGVRDLSRALFKLSLGNPELMELSMKFTMSKMEKSLGHKFSHEPVPTETMDKINQNFMEVFQTEEMLKIVDDIQASGGDLGERAKQFMPHMIKVQYECAEKEGFGGCEEFMRFYATIQNWVASDLPYAKEWVAWRETLSARLNQM